MKESLFEVIFLLFHLQHLQNVDWNNQLCYWGYQFQYYWKQGYNSHHFFCSCLSICLWFCTFSLSPYHNFEFCFVWKVFFVSFMIWVLLLFSWRYLFLSMLFFVLNHFVPALFLFAKTFFNRFVTPWFLFFFVLFQPKAAVCRLQNVNSYKMRWKIDPYCCSEIWFNCFPVPFCIFQTVFCCWRQTYWDV